MPSCIINSYHPFGMLMPKRNVISENYRFGFNGQEKDDEISGTGNHNTALFWEYDTRLMRRWNIDPVVKTFESPYAVFGDNPIFNVDPFGNDWFKNEKTGKTAWNEATGKQGEQVSLIGSEDTYTNLGTEMLEFNGKQLTYSSQTKDKDGKLQVISQVFDAVSGKPNDVSGFNVEKEFDYSKTRQGVPDAGPTPEGLYSINKNPFVEGANESGLAKYDDLSLFGKVKSVIGGSNFPGGAKSWGDYRWKLNFEDVKTNRKDFYLHGGEVWGSRGCIDLGGGINNFEKSFMSSQLGNTKVFLNVVYQKDLRYQILNLPANQPLQIRK